MICVYTSTEMGTDRLSISYYIPNESINRKESSCFPSWGQSTDDEGWVADYIDIDGWNKNDFE